MTAQQWFNLITFGSLIVIGLTMTGILVNVVRWHRYSKVHTDALSELATALNTATLNALHAAREAMHDASAIVEALCGLTDELVKHAAQDDVPAKRMALPLPAADESAVCMPCRCDDGGWTVRHCHYHGAPVPETATSCPWYHKDQVGGRVTWPPSGTDGGSNAVGFWVAPQ